MSGTEGPSQQRAIAEIATYLRQWCRGETDCRLTNRLIAVAVGIALQSYTPGRRIRAAAAAGDTKSGHMAMSLLAELFVGSGPESRRGYALCDVVDASDAILYSKFCGVAKTVVRQELFHRWVLEDPFSAHLWKRLHKAIRRDSRIMAFPADHPDWIAAVSIGPTADLDPIDQSTLDRLVSAVYRPKMHTGDIIFAVINHPDCRGKAIAVDDLFESMRRCIPSALAATLEDESSAPLSDPDYTLAVEQTIASIRPAISGLIDRYQTAGKIPEGLSPGFAAALLDLAVDWGEGGPAVSQFEYLQTHLPDMGYNEYRAKHRAMFEYMAEKVAGWFIDGMRRFYFEK